MLAKTYKWDLGVVYVIDTSTVKDLLISKIFIEEESSQFEKDLEANGQRYLNYISELAQKKGVKAHTLLKRGGISTMILEAAQEFDAQLILLGAWETKRSKRDLITRAHMDILMDANRSVLIIKEEDIENLYKRF